MKILAAADLLARAAEREASIDDLPLSYAEWEDERTSGRDIAAAPSPMYRTNYNRCVRNLASSFGPNLVGSKHSYEFRSDHFDPDLFVSEPSPAFLFDRADILREAGARIILAGPPGTGKSALVGELARRMRLRIIERGGGDLFARAWGQAERNIAAAVKESRGAILFLDEADALVGSRDNDSDHNLHLTVSATSAFLSAIQEPCPDSPIIIATNRLDAIDRGICRRFDFVLTTQTLPREKEIIAWRQILKREPPVNWKPIGNTVPADYSKARRRIEFSGRVDAESLAAAIRSARTERDGTEKHAIGFAAHR